jgi:hypothetical protein
MLRKGTPQPWVGYTADCKLVMLVPRMPDIDREGRDLPSGKTPPEIGAHRWNRMRLEILRWLKGGAPSCADLYDTAVRLLLDTEMPARACMVAHAVREIGNRLPARFGSTVGGERVLYSDEINVIVRQWRDAGLPIGDALPDVAEAGGEPRISRRIPIQLFNRISALLTAHEMGASRVRDRARDLFTLARKEEGATEAQLITAIEQWIKVHRWFQQLVHRDMQDDKLLTDEFLQKFELFERLLHTLAANYFFEVVKELDEILDEANR